MGPAIDLPADAEEILLRTEADVWPLAVCLPGNPDMAK